MAIKIMDKSDQESVSRIIEIGYPNNIEYLDELLSWSCDPNWPISKLIYEYFVELGELEVLRVLNVSEKADDSWRYSMLMNLISSYDRGTLEKCVNHLKVWASDTSSGECDIESIRILTDNKLISNEEIANIAKRNLFVYNVMIKETLEAAGEAIYSLPLSDHLL